MTDPNNVGAIYRSAKSIWNRIYNKYNKKFNNETALLLNTACGAFETVNSYKANNISNAVKSLKKNNWWVVGLDHKAKINITDIINKMKKEDKFIFILGSEERV